MGSDSAWDPIAKRIESLGGVIEPYTMAMDWVYEGRRSQASVPRLRIGGPQLWRNSVEHREIPIESGSERTIDDFDFVVSAIPHAVIVTMNASDERMWSSSYFRRLKNLRSAATVSMRVVTKRPAFPFRGPVFGFPAPLGIGVNMTEHLIDKPEGGGSVIAFVGQERGFESWTDSQIVSFTLDNFARDSRIGDLRASGIVSLDIHRNRADFERILLCEPGVDQFRPGPRTPFTNLFLSRRLGEKRGRCHLHGGGDRLGIRGSRRGARGDEGAMIGDPFAPEADPYLVPNNAEPTRVGRRVVLVAIGALTALATVSGCVQPRVACLPSSATSDAPACEHRFCRYYVASVRSCQPSATSGMSGRT